MDAFQHCYLSNAFTRGFFGEPKDIEALENSSQILHTNETGNLDKNDEKVRFIGAELITVHIFYNRRTAREI